MAADPRYRRRSRSRISFSPPSSARRANRTVRCRSPAVPSRTRFAEVVGDLVLGDDPLAGELTTEFREHNRLLAQGDWVDLVQRVGGGVVGRVGEQRERSSPLVLVAKMQSSTTVIPSVILLDPRPHPSVSNDSSRVSSRPASSNRASMHSAAPDEASARSEARAPRDFGVLIFVDRLVEEISTPSLRRSDRPNADPIGLVLSKCALRAGSSHQGSRRSPRYRRRRPHRRRTRVRCPWGIAAAGRRSPATR